jgi:hypothetical protein
MVIRREEVAEERGKAGSVRKEKEKERKIA